MVGRRRMAAAVAGMLLGCIVRAERWMAGARGLGAVCCTAASLVLEQSWPWRRSLRCLANVSWAYVAHAVCGTLWWLAVAQ